MKYDADEVADALTDSGGVVAAAARSLGCARQTIYSYVERFDDVEKALRASRRSLVAEAENALVDMMRDPEHRDHYKATMKVLETYDESANWSGVHRHEHAAASEAGLRVVISNGTWGEDEGEAS